MRRRKAGAERRAEILDAMLAMAAEVGPDRVTTKALASRLGVTEPALYRHFPGGKSEMWGALAAVVGEHMQAVWTEALEKGGPASDKAMSLACAQLRLIAGTPALPAILFSRALHRDNPALRIGVTEVMGRFHAWLSEILEESRNHGEFRNDLDADAAAWVIVSVVQGTAMRWSLSDRVFDLEREGGRIMEAAIKGFEAR